MVADARDLKASCVKYRLANAKMIDASTDLCRCLGVALQQPVQFRGVRFGNYRTDFVAIQNSTIVLRGIALLLKRQIADLHRNFCHARPSAKRLTNTRTSLRTYPAIAPSLRIVALSQFTDFDFHPLASPTHLSHIRSRSV